MNPNSFNDQDPMFPNAGVGLESLERSNGLYSVRFKLTVYFCLIFDQSVTTLNAVITY